MSDQTVAGFRLSNQQMRTWSQQAGGRAPFWAECEIGISGALDLEKLNDSLRDIVRRHEILRTGFHLQTGVTAPFQVIRDAADFNWTAADISTFAPAQQRAELGALVAAHDSVFDLDKGPALHVVVAEVAPQRYTMLLRLPAMCADRQTLSNLVGEIAERYAAGSLPAEETMQYADIAEWQQEMLASEESKASRDYWRDSCRKLDVDALATSLAAFSQRDRGDFAPAFVERHVTAASLGGYAGDQLPEFLLTAWIVLLARMTGRSAVTVGCYFDGRNYEELSSAVGAFARVLPLTAEVSEGMRFEDLLNEVGRDRKDFANLQDGFSWHGAALSGGDDSGPVLPLAFEYSELPPPVTRDGLTMASLRQEVITERFELKLSARRVGELVNLALYYDSGRLDRATVEQWLGHLVTLLRAAANAKNAPVHQLPLLDDAERGRLLVDWNQTAADYPRSACIHTLFEAQAAKTPHAPAVRYQDACLTFEQLNRRANQLAHHLRAKGVRANDLVGLCLDRSTDMMVAVLGILKAGCAYVPLSAEHPKPRLTQQLAGVAALVTESKFECLMPAIADPVILIDRDKQASFSHPDTNPEPSATPDSYAYVIYTSGSTGTPKGVAVRHRNLVNYTTFIQRRLELEKFPQPLHFATVSTLGADLGNTCIYPSLVSGGCLHVIASDTAADSHRLQEYMKQYPVDVLKIVPSHLTALLNSGGGREVLPRKYLILGGEAFTQTLLEKLLAAGGTCEILNHYGPTETTIGSLTLRLKDFQRESSNSQTIPIGRPIANTRVYILDAFGEPVPVGVAGELCIAGDGVTAGYVGQPEITAERFVPEALGPKPGETMYRTGDLVRYLPDGNVEFLGRADDQVKIRGFRIELGEVEAVLVRHPEVSQTAVLAIADERGEKSLAAYFVGTATRDALRSYLRDQLPDYMVPSVLIPLPKMPLNANGKVDRRALPKPDEVREGTRDAVAPRTPGEEVVAGIWCEVLKRDDIGVEDNFFEIGGHSLLATQIASRLREHFKIPVPVRAVFEFPSIAELARQMDSARREEQGMVPPAIAPVSREGDLPLSFAQERLWVLDQIEPNNPLYNIPRTLRLRGSLRIEALERAINEIVCRHESQRTSFSVKDGDPIQVIAPNLTIPLVQHDLTAIPEPEREAAARRLAMEESMRPFDLRQLPLVRAHLLRLSENDHVLQLTMHHIISDAWSAGIFLQELGVLYEAFCAGRTSPLPELKVQYADYAAQERAWLQGEVLQKQLAFWRERLKGIPPVLNLPLDRERPTARTFAGSCEMLHIPFEQLARVKELARHEGATLFMILMAAFQAMLAKYSGDEQIVVGTDLANRTMPETERMIGFFINLLAVRTDLSGNPTFRELVGRAREGLLESYAHQEVPFPKIVQEVQPERSATHNPIVQVLFVMQNIPRSKRELYGLQVEPFEVPVTSSKFDMALFVAERPEGLVGYWVYSTELFESATIQRMLRHFRNLLERAVAQPDARLSSLSMLSAEELERQETEKQSRKQSQFSKLKATAPAAVGLAPESTDKPSS